MSELQGMQAQLDRMENNLSDGLQRVAEALEKLATIEAQQAAMRDNHAGIWKRIDDHEIRLRNTETLATGNAFMGRWMERGAWIAFVVIIEIASGRWTS